MKLKDFCRRMDSIAPQELAMEYDNVGLLIAPEHDEIKKVLVALDCTPTTAEEAISWGADLLLTHHPILFHPVQNLSGEHSEMIAIRKLMRHGIGHFATHTNFDACEGGVNDTLAQHLGLRSVRPLPSEPLGRMGELAEPIPFAEFASRIETLLHTTVLSIGSPDTLIRTVGLIGGGGGGEAVKAWQDGCDAYVTGEMRHHESLEAQRCGICCAVAGHYETEVLAMKSLIDRLQTEENDVQYQLTCTERSPFVRFEGGKHE